MTRKYALTGGPGTGKSTLLTELQRRGIYTMKEVAEYIIERELKKENGMLPWTNRDGFQKKLLETQLEWEREIPKEIEISFQDRGIADGIAFYRLDGLKPPKELIQAARNANYAGVFLLDPHQNYQNTEIRRESQETALKIHKEIAQAYEELGYNIIRIPASSLDYRAEHILDLINFKPKRTLEMRT
jgi:predicted ATPase